MRQLSPLHDFGHGEAAPYTRRWQDGTSNYVFPVRLRVEYGIPLMFGMRVHRIKDAAGTRYNGRIHLGARWLCNVYSTDIQLLASPANSAAPLCKKCEHAAKPSVYRCFDAEGRLLYVGHSSNVPMRTADHTRYSPWWPAVAEVTTELFGSVTEALLAEERAIHAESPIHNGPSYLAA